MDAPTLGPMRRGVPRRLSRRGTETDSSVAGRRCRPEPPLTSPPTATWPPGRRIRRNCRGAERCGATSGQHPLRRRGVSGILVHRGDAAVLPGRDACRAHVYLRHQRGRVRRVRHRMRELQRLQRHRDLLSLHAASGLRRASELPQQRDCLPDEHERQLSDRLQVRCTVRGRCRGQLGLPRLLAVSVTRFRT